MGKERIRVFALARELDMESKDLLTVCRQAGIAYVDITTGEFQATEIRSGAELTMRRYAISS